MKKVIFKLAHMIAKTLTGDYSARMAMALKEAYRLASLVDVDQFILRLTRKFSNMRYDSCDDRLQVPVLYIDGRYCEVFKGHKDILNAIGNAL